MLITFKLTKKMLFNSCYPFIYLDFCLYFFNEIKIEIVYACKAKWLKSFIYYVTLRCRPKIKSRIPPIFISSLAYHLIIEGLQGRVA